jgi:hypothetical protein
VQQEPSQHPLSDLTIGAASAAVLVDVSSIGFTARTNALAILPSASSQPTGSLAASSPVSATV